MIHAHADPSHIAGEIINAVRCRPAQFGKQKIMHADLLRFPLGTQFPPAILEVSHQFFLLGVHRHHGLFVGQKALDLAIDVFELGIAVGMAVAFLALAIGLQTVARPPLT